ncbi:MAG TPA: hypothetical protein VIY86_08235, partial [Pirellulaceae bacterium]
IAAKDVRAANRLLEMTTMEQIFSDEDLEVQSSLASRINLIGRSRIENTTEFIYPTEYTSPETPDSPRTATAFEMRPIGTTAGIDGYWDGALGKMQYALEHLVFVGFANYGNGAEKSVLQPVFQSWSCSVEAHLDGSLVIAGGGRIPRPVISGEMKEEAAQSGQVPAHIYFAIDAEALPHR